ncbi:MAG: 1-acyl-sn-glycerol-3-phosphate acyltransferase [Clostridiaceae bacterium]|nr:1-acyl-sn-glycerol-3-phosphate acyltransferase [Clostridiaceae bacterium]
MRKISFYAYILRSFAGTIPPKIKLNKIKNKGTKEEADALVNKTVLNWSRSVINKVGIKVYIKGSENIPSESCLFVANHQGNFDFFAMMAYIPRPIGFVAKKEIGQFPYVPQWMKEMHCVFIDRDNPRESVRAINEAAENLKNGYSMVIFPEGTRSKGHKMGEFKKGSLKLAIKSGVPIVPVTIDGSYKVYEEGNGKQFKPAEINIIIDKAIYIDELIKEDQKDVTSYVQRIIQRNLDSL